MASFQKYQTKEGTKWMFMAYTTIDPMTGKKKRTTRRGFKTKKEAQLAAYELEKEVYHGNFIKEEDILFKNFVPTFIEMYSKQAKISSVELRKKELKKLLHYFSNIRLKDISKLKYQQALNDLHEKGYVRTTIEGIHTAGRMLFRKAVELEIIKNNPTEFAVVPRKVETVEELEKNEKKIKYLEKKDLALFLNTAKDHGLENDYIFFMILAYTGIRIGELLALKWSDVSFEKNTISITKTMFNPNGNKNDYVLLPPKTKGSIRIIKVDERVMDLLKEHKKEQIMNNLYSEELNFVITKYNGFPEYPNHAPFRMKRLLKICGIKENLTPHSLRHTHTSLLIEAGVGIKEIQQRLGHTDINTTMNIYAHLTNDMEEKASKKFSSLMENLLN
ncbi:site-specific integrase [Gottfriedia acidiceleris]|uniref:site-specific integrase n=1 Tax=Gottfriedia acidiceleris TaxID=371036 RepID=UPI002F264FD4